MGQNGRRPNGTGSYAKRGAGTYRLRVYVGLDPATGTPRQVSRTVKAKDDREARRLLTGFCAEVAEGRVSSATTLGRLLDDHLADLRRRGRTDTTMQRYTAAVEHHIRPGLGNVRLDQLGPRDLEGFYSALMDRGLSAASVRPIHAVISGACSRAVKWGWLVSNPAALVELPHDERAKERFVPTPAQVARMLTHPDPDLRWFAALAAFSGGRRGELTGLRWEDVAFEPPTLHIHRQWVRLDGGPALRPLKTSRKGVAERWVPLGPLALQHLHARRQHIAALVGHAPEGWLLSRDDQTPMSPRWANDACGRLGKMFDPPLPLSPHSFRYFFVTYLQEAADPKTAMALAGHTNLHMTMHYTRAVDDRSRAAAAGLSAVVSAASDQERVVDLEVLLAAETLPQTDRPGDEPAGMGESHVAGLHIAG